VFTILLLHLCCIISLTLLSICIMLMIRALEVLQFQWNLNSLSIGRGFHCYILMHSFWILELSWKVSLMCLNYLLEPLIVFTMVMWKMKCPDCLPSMNRNLVQLGLKGLLCLMLVLVKGSKHGERSILVLVRPLAVPLLHLLHLVVLMSCQHTWTVILSRIGGVLGPTTVVAWP
jgi:hypothetical protein